MSLNEDLINQIRKFNRFYTNIIGLLDRQFLDTPFSLTEGRVLYEIHHTEFCTAKKVRANIDIDEGYLSRIIDKFIKGGLVRKTPASDDRRLHVIVPTEKGQREFAKLNDNSNKMIAQMIEKLSEQEHNELVEMMSRIHELLGKSLPAKREYEQNEQDNISC